MKLGVKLEKKWKIYFIQTSLNIFSLLVWLIWFWSKLNCLKVTVQFETEGNGQNEIVSLMDRSEVKL